MPGEVPGVHVRRHAHTREKYTMSRALLATAICSTLVSVAGSSRACWPQGYSFNEYSTPLNVSAAEGSGLIICPTDDTRFCPDGGDLLRQNVNTGEVVVLSPTCYNGWPTPAEGADPRILTRCYVDECVPSGVYRYGYAVPFVCGDCGTYYFHEITIESDAGTDCQRVHGVPAPTPFQGQVPWKDEAVRCRGGSVDSSNCGCKIAVGGRSKAWLSVVVTVGLTLAVWQSRRRSRS
jgi:hypothetical protein